LNFLMAAYTLPLFSMLKRGTCTDDAKQDASRQAVALMRQEDVKAAGDDPNAVWTGQLGELSTGCWEAWYTAIALRACLFLCFGRIFDKSASKAAMIKWTVEVNKMPVTWATFARIAAAKQPEVPPPFTLIHPYNIQIQALTGGFM
jgi:hypothetical protein